MVRNPKKKAANKKVDVKSQMASKPATVPAPVKTTPAPPDNPRKVATASPKDPGHATSRASEQGIIRELEEKVTLLSKSNRQLKRKVFDLYTIFEISRNFNAVLDYELLLETFIFTCLGQLGSLKGAIFLKRDVDAHEFHLVRAKGSGKLPTTDDFFRENTKLAQYITKLNRPVLVSELSTEMAPADEWEILNGFELGVVVPLIHQTRLSGLFLLADKISQTEFTPDDIEFLSALGNQIAVAIENARLYEAEKTAMHQLREAQEKLVQTERLAALGEMSAKIAHEVNNPLGIIKNYLHLLRRVVDDPTQISEYTAIVKDEIDRIADIVAQLREFQRPATMEMRPVDVRDVADQTIRLTERQLQSSSITIERHYDRGPYLVLGRADSLKQVFLNLIINARSAMGAGGKLTIEMAPTKTELVISVMDTGPGIPPDVVPRIFEPFFTTKGEKGTGLGLSVCHGIIKAHKGSIEYKDSNSGGCFEIRLPLIRG